MAARRYLEAAVPSLGSVEEQHCGGDALRSVRHVDPVGVVLVEGNGTATASALEVQLLGVESYLVAAQHVSHRLDQPCVVGTRL